MRLFAFGGYCICFKATLAFSEVYHTSAAFKFAVGFGSGTAAESEGYAAVHANKVIVVVMACEYTHYVAHFHEIEECTRVKCRRGAGPFVTRTVGMRVVDYISIFRQGDMEESQ